MYRLIKIKIMRDQECLEDRLPRWMQNLCEIEGGRLSFHPPVDLSETSQGLVLRMEVAGVAKDDLSITFCAQELVIRGRRRPLHPEGVTRLLCQEISHGCFERRFRIPIPVDAAGLRAQYLDGILEVFLPRMAPVKRRIPVQEVPES
jgi:HSP20 family protein